MDLYSCLATFRSIQREKYREKVKKKKEKVEEKEVVEKEGSRGYHKRKIRDKF